MLAVEGIYRDNQLIFNKRVSFSEPVRVVVTFLDEPQNDSQKIDLAQFSFVQSRETRESQALSLVAAMQMYFSVILQN
jgi:hypothetical protein